jgi:hypothetical protein
MLNVRKDLIGKTITGIIAVPGEEQRVEGRVVQKPCEIWMMQFSDGSHVEFVSPAARRGLQRSATRSTLPRDTQQSSPQLALNVA